MKKLQVSMLLSICMIQNLNNQKYIVKKQVILSKFEKIKLDLEDVEVTTGFIYNTKVLKVESKK